jgi:hypothetical protein
MDLISMGEGSHEAMKEGGQGAALPYDAGGGGVPRAAASAAAATPPAPLAAHLRHLHRYLRHQLLILCSGSSSHTPLYRPM